MSSLREPTRSELWAELLGGTLDVHTVAMLLHEPDLWLVPGLTRRTIGCGEMAFMCVLVDPRDVFERWLEVHRPELQGEWRAALVLRALENDDDGLRYGGETDQQFRAWLK